MFEPVGGKSATIQLNTGPGTERRNHDGMPKDPTMGRGLNSISDSPRHPGATTLGQRLNRCRELRTCGNSFGPHALAHRDAHTRVLPPRDICAAAMVIVVGLGPRANILLVI
jgi:hypothetical protein